MQMLKIGGAKKIEVIEWRTDCPLHPDGEWIVTGYRWYEDGMRPYSTDIIDNSMNVLLMNGYEWPDDEYLNSNVQGWHEYYLGPYYAGYVELKDRPTSPDPEKYQEYAKEYTKYFKNMMYVAGTRWMQGIYYERITQALGKAKNAVDRVNNGWAVTELYQNEDGEYGAVIGYLWSKSEVICPETIYVYGLGNIRVIGLDVENHVIEKLYVPDNVLLIKRLQSASLIELTGMQGVEEIKSWAFQNDAELVALPFMPNLRIINTFAFESCVSLRQILLPIYLEKIAWSAFGWYDYVIGNYDWGTVYSGSDFYEYGSTYLAMNDDDKIYGITLYTKPDSQTWNLLDSMINKYVYACYSMNENGVLYWDVIGDDPETKASQKEWNGHLNLNDEKNYQGGKPPIVCTIDPSNQSYDDDFGPDELGFTEPPIIDISDYLGGDSNPTGTGQTGSNAGGLLPIDTEPQIKVINPDDNTQIIITIIAGVTLVTIITASGTVTLRYGGGNQMPTNIDIVEWWQHAGSALNFQGDFIGATADWVQKTNGMSDARKTEFAILENGLIGMAQDYTVYRNNGDDELTAWNKAGYAAFGKTLVSYGLKDAGMVPAIWDTIMQECFGGTDFGDRLGIYNNAGLFFQYGHDTYFNENCDFRKNAMNGEYGFIMQTSTYIYNGFMDFENEFNWLEAGWDNTSFGDSIYESFIDKNTGKSIFDPYVNNYGETLIKGFSDNVRNSKGMGSIIDAAETYMKAKGGDTKVVEDYLIRQLGRMLKPL